MQVPSVVASRLGHAHSPPSPAKVKVSVGPLHPYTLHGWRRSLKTTRPPIPSFAAPCHPLPRRRHANQSILSAGTLRHASLNVSWLSSSECKGRRGVTDSDEGLGDKVTFLPRAILLHAAHGLNTLPAHHASRAHRPNTSHHVLQLCHGSKSSEEEYT